MTTFRQDLTAAMVASIDAFIVSHPQLLRRSERGRPPSVVGDLPLAFVDGRDERIHFDAQTMDRVMTIAVVVVSALGDNVETLVRHDIATDALVQHFNVTSIHFVPNSSWTDLVVSDEDYPVDSDDGTTRHFFATRFTFTVSLMEGASARGPAVFLLAPPATPEAIALALNAASLLSIANPPGATGESIALALIAAGLFGTGAVDPPTVTAEELVLVLIAAGLMVAA